jgi:hypothetical protein
MTPMLGRPDELDELDVRQVSRGVLLAILVVVPLVLFGATGNCSGHDCTDIGCDSGVVIDLPTLAGRSEGSRTASLPVAPLTIERCVNGVCEIEQREPLQTGSVTMFPLARGRDSVIESASVRVSGPSGETLMSGRFRGRLTTVRLQPNGPGCGPTCYAAYLRLTDSGSLVPTSRSAIDAS